jgi:hypothetical protein
VFVTEWNSSALIKAAAARRETLNVIQDELRQIGSFLARVGRGDRRPAWRVATLSGVTRNLQRGNCCEIGIR